MLHIERRPSFNSRKFVSIINQGFGEALFFVRHVDHKLPKIKNISAAILQKAFRDPEYLTEIQ
ncbi:hypothetical protein CRM22_010912, partial [Opisthorchis felineus]